jgi:hypothetical protein
MLIDYPDYGWTNYATLCVHLWLTNDGATYHHCCSLAAACQTEKFLLSDRLKEFVEELNPLRDQANVFSDMLSATISEVDWHEVAQAFLWRIANQPKDHDCPSMLVDYPDDVIDAMYAEHLANNGHYEDN